MALSRSFDRNVHVFDSLRPDEPLGGLFLNPSVTNRKFLRMLAVFIYPSGWYRVWLQGAKTALNPGEEILKLGCYYNMRDSPDRCHITVQCFETITDLVMKRLIFFHSLMKNFSKL
ncbi:hypothetical protein V1525DRAFT_240343 [Lipomyces kononenkoae]|uniref:Uncharacterized protein n=1 Tax=Lipomyces kononenkoae TaxID=34357 RepID=A0ACC3SXL6_LIPKO